MTSPVTVVAVSLEYEPSQCLWNATRKNSAQWCRDHVEEWAYFITDILDRFANKDVHCEITCDKLGGVIASRNASATSTQSQYLGGSIRYIESIITAVALRKRNSDHEISQEVLDTWELNQEIFQMDDVNLISTSKSGGLYVTIGSNGPDAIFRSDKKDVGLDYIKFMRDPCSAAPKIVLMIKTTVEFNKPEDLSKLRAILDTTADEISNDSTTTTYNVNNSGTHFLLDMGDSKMAEWHSNGDIVIRLSKTGGPNYMESNATW